MTDSISRREFIVKLVSGAGFTLSVSLLPDLRPAWSQQARGRSEVEIFSPSAWLQITSDNIVTVIVNKSEMGQGVTTVLPMIAAEELDADWERVRFETAPSRERYVDPVSGAQSTEASSSVRHMSDPLRFAGAVARAMLIRAASETWEVPPGECEAVKGTIRHAGSGRSLTFGELCRHAARLPVPKNPPIKRRTANRIIGTKAPRLDIPAKIDGSAIFGMDVFVDGMLYASIVRPPAFGAKLLSFDREAALKTQGVRQILDLGGGRVAVCAEYPYAVWKGRKALNDKWSKGGHPGLTTASIEGGLRAQLRKQGISARSDGDVKGALSKAAKRVSAVFALPFLAHATMEPMNCTAHVRSDGCDIWVPTQNQSGAVETAARITGLRPDQINLYTTYVGGGFGRRIETDFVEEAVVLSKAAGKPIKVVRAREEDTRSDFYRPATCSEVEAGIDREGRVTAWSHKIVAPSIWARVAPARMEGGIDPSAVDGVLNTPYEIPNFLVEYVRFDTPAPVGFWRSDGNSHNAFVVESFLDMLAAAAGKDPVQIRLEMLKNNPRAQRVIEIAAEQSGWSKKLPEGRGLGVAHHSCAGSCVAMAADVSVDEKKGAVRVHKVVCAVDCGPVIHQDTIVSQMEGGIIFGLSAALKEKVEFAGGGVLSAGFSNYPILTISETPEIEVHIVGSAGERGGVGEIGTPPIAPAVANAVFAATGARMFELPMTPAAVRRQISKGKKTG